MGVLFFVGRRRAKNPHNYPPRFHWQHGAGYRVAGGIWTFLSRNLADALRKHAELEGKPFTDGSFGALIDRYLEHCEGRTGGEALSKATLRNYRTLSRPIRKAFGHGQISDIQSNHIADLRDAYPHASMANNMIVLLRQIFGKAREWGLRRDNPARGIRIRYVAKRDRYITDAEYIAIRSCAPDWLAIMMDVSLITGAREGDVVKILLSDIRPTGLFIRQGKTGKRSLFESPWLDRVIERAKTLKRTVRSVYLIQTENRPGHPYSVTTVQGRFRQACIEAGITNAHFHDLRAKAATDGKAEGLDYQALLGHSDRSMSDKYVKRREVERVTARKREI